MKNSSEKIFFDEKQRRWRYSRRGILTLVLFLVGICSITLGSIFINSKLPQLSLESPEDTYRDIPKVIRQSNPTNPNNLIDYTETLDKNKINPKLNYKPKTIGFYVNWDDNSFISLKQNIGKIDQLIPEWLHLKENDGSILLNDSIHQEEVKAFINKENPELSIFPLLNNFNPETDEWNREISKLLNDSEAKSNLIQNTLNYVQENKFSGIVLDFQLISYEDQAPFLIFTQELYEKFHSDNLKVIISVPIDNPDFNLSKIEKHSDYLIFMAYDEHASFIAGPIASQNWIYSNLKKHFSEIPHEKIIVALGGYGYDWEEGEEIGNEITFQKAMEIAQKAGSEINFDPESFNPNYSYADERGIHQVWYLDGVTAFNSIITTKNLGDLYGFALWRLGSEDPSFWEIINKYDFNKEDIEESLTNIQFG